MSVFGLQLTPIIKDGLTSMAASLSEFRAAAQADRVRFPDALTATWHTELFPGGLSKIIVGQRYTPDMIAKAAIWIEDSEAPVGARALGDFVGYSAGQYQLGYMVAETATIYVYHQSQELCRLLASLLAGRLLIQTPYLLAAGYMSVDYEGSGPLGALELASNGWLDVNIRTISYRAQLQRRLTNTNMPILDRDLSALPIGATNPDGITGTVLATTVES